MCLFSPSFELARFITATTISDAISVEELFERLPIPLRGNGTPESEKRNLRNRLKPLFDDGHICRVEGGRAARFYKTPHFNTLLTQLSAIEKGRVNKASSERLNDFELQERLIGLGANVVDRLDNGLMERVGIIKDAIQHKRKLVFSYVKSKQGKSERIVEPIGIIKDGRHTVMIAFNKHGSIRAYTVMKMLELFKKHGEKHFHPLSQSDAIAILQSGIEEHFLSEHKEHIVLELSSKAVDLYREERPRFCEDWQFENTDSSFRKARVTFKRRLSVKFIEDLMSLGHHVNIIGSERLINEIRENQLDFSRVG
ncbi:MAG: WYL domain-containing protein [Paraglaciecola sp.]|uniref:helix-turn-helix transcriptional regulator n=1 Tax=Paraglaciecola sp. TaxID=1920173 RepID=UPI0032994168